MAKAVIYWEPATRRRAPPSRHDQVQPFCKTNISDGVMCWKPLERYGPLRGLMYAFDFLDRSTEQDTVVFYVCPSKNYAWNFKPCMKGGHGSIEFRRPPGVTTAASAKYWIAFTMTFVDLALLHSPQEVADRLDLLGPDGMSLSEVYLGNFQEQLNNCARELGVQQLLEDQTASKDDIDNLYLTKITDTALAYLQSIDDRYKRP